MAQTQYTMDAPTDTRDAQTGRAAPVVDEAEVRALDKDYLIPVFARLPITLVRGQGARVWDADGKEYLDFLAGIAVNGVGHCHPRVVRAIQEQAATLIHTAGYYYTEPVARLAKKLTSISKMDRAFFGNSGAEAVEAALKIARKWGHERAPGKKFGIVTALNSFHGRTMATITATGQPKYSAPFAPLLPGISHIPFNDIDALEAAVTDDTCAVLLEPIQGESGIYPAHRPFLEAARALCDRHNALLIFDEIQTGIGRTGTWWAYEQYGVVPDVMTSAKSLGGGIPIGACLARGAAATTLTLGDHGSTFGGNPLAAHTALAVLQTIEDEHLLANAHAMGAYFVHRLNELMHTHKLTDIRGVGLMVGVTLAAPDAKRVQTEAREQGLIINAIGDNVLRFLPPLIINQSDVDRAMDVLTAVI